MPHKVGSRPPERQLAHATTRPMMKPAANYCILIPAWGKRYVERALDYCLASLMAPGNVGALLSTDQVTFVFLTEQSSQDFYTQHPLVKGLPRETAVEFVWIDDLIIPPSYGVTLTLAYARAIQQLQVTSPAPVFVFANADFVFSEHALAYIRDAMNDGADGIACPSVRCVEDDVLDRIDAHRQANGVLNLSADFLIGQIYDYPHMTDLAATLPNNFLHHTNPNHIYIGDWKTALVGFWYLRFMLAIRPVHKLDRVGCFCDYSFMAQMVPDERINYPEDARDVFLLELSDANQESSYVAFGIEGPKEVAARVEKFSTAFHRECARHPYLIERKPNPGNRSVLRAAAIELAADIENHFTKPPHDWRNHPYWIRARIHLRLQGYRLPETIVAVDQSEMRALPIALASRLNVPLRTLRRNLHTWKSNILLTLFRPIAKSIFVNIFLRSLPQLNDLRETLQQGETVILSTFRLAEYLCAFCEGDAVLVTNHHELRALLRRGRNENERLRIAFLGDINEFLEFQTTVAQQFRANIDVVREIIIVPNHISNRHMEMLRDYTTQLLLTREVSFLPRGEQIVKAEASLRIFNRLCGFSPVSRIGALLIFLVETALVEPYRRTRRHLGRPSLWNVITTRPRTDMVAGSASETDVSCQAR